MYYNSLVDVPEVPGKITIRKGVYVMYETGRRYNPEKNIIFRTGSRSEKYALARREKCTQMINSALIFRMWNSQN